MLDCTSRERKEEGTARYRGVSQKGEQVVTRLFLNDKRADNGSNFLWEGTVREPRESRRKKLRQKVNAGVEISLNRLSNGF